LTARRSLRRPLRGRMARTYRHSLSQGVRLAPVPWLIRLAVVYGINVLALIVVDWMFDSVTIGRWWSLLLGAFVLTIGNLIIKPILAILTLPLIIVTFGLAYFAINVLMLALAEWIAPDFSIDGFWTYVGATIVVWLVNVAVGWLLDKVTGD
jgi:putative membrane protein